MKSSRNFPREGSVTEDFVVLALCDPDGLAEEPAFAVRDLLNAQKPEGWWFLNPGSFMVFFLSALSGAERATACAAAIQKVQDTLPSLSGLRYGRSEGPLVANFDVGGRLTTMRRVRPRMQPAVRQRRATIIA